MSICKENSTDSSANPAITILGEYDGYGVDFCCRAVSEAIIPHKINVIWDNNGSETVTSCTNKSTFIPTIRETLGNLPNVDTTKIVFTSDEGKKVAEFNAQFIYGKKEEIIDDAENWLVINHDTASKIEALSGKCIKLAVITTACIYDESYMTNVSAEKTILAALSAYYATADIQIIIEK